jgi:integrase
MPGHVRARGKRADGSTKWQARWRPADDPSDCARVERNFKSKREAERWVTRMDSDVLRGAYADPRKGERLFSIVADELRGVWDAKGLEPKTRAGYEAILSRWLTGDADPLRPGRPSRFRDTKVATVTTATVQEFIREVAAVRAPNTVRRIYGVINAVMRLAAQRGYVATNPCEAVELPSKKRAGVRRSHLYLEGVELRKLAEALPDPWKVPVYVAGSCGLRAGELWALRRRDIDLLHGELIVRYALKEVHSKALADDDKGLIVGPPKSAASRRRLAIASGLAPMLAAVLGAPGVRGPEGYAVAREVNEDRANLAWSDDGSDPDRLLFVTTSGYPVRHNQFFKRVYKPAVRAALPARLHGLRFHDLRHTCAALSLAANPNLTLVKERLGHENIATTIDLYGKRVPSVDAALADAVGASIFAAADSVTALRQAL